MSEAELCPRRVVAQVDDAGESQGQIAVQSATSQLLKAESTSSFGFTRYIMIDV